MMLPEVDLLLYCFRLQMGEAHEARLNELLQRPLNWRLLLKLAIMHGMDPLLYAHLQNQPIPPSVQIQLWTQYQHHAQQNQQMVWECLQLTALLARHGITAVPFKGVLLATAVYDNLALRPCGDIDLLIPETAVSQCQTILTNAGYLPEHPFTVAQEKVWRQISCERRFIHPKRPFPIDLHWQMAPHQYGLQFSHSFLWDDLVSYSSGGSSVQTFSPEKLLLLLCFHGYKHGWERLIWLCDIAALLQRNPDLNWTAVTTWAATYHIQRTLLLGAALASQLFNTPIPPTIQARIEAESQLSDLVQHVCKRLALVEPMPPRGNSFARYRFHIKGRERIWDRFCYTMRKVVMASIADLVDRQYSEAYTFLYFLRRPFRLIGKYRRKLWKKLLSRREHVW